MTQSKRETEAYAAIITHLVSVEHRSQYLAWLHDITQVAQAFPGHIRAEEFRKETDGVDTHQIVVSFDSDLALKSWLSSSERAALLERAKPIIQTDLGFREIGLLEQLAAPTGPVPPAQYKIVLLTWLGVSICVMALALTLGPIMQTWPFMVRHVVNSGLVVAALAYAVMPLLKRIFTRWLSAS